MTIFLATSVIILLTVCIIQIVVIRRSLLKLEMYEDITESQVNYLVKFSRAIQESQKRLNEIDEKGSFKSDDEVGYFFEQLKEIQRELDLFMLPNTYGEKEIKQ